MLEVVLTTLLTTAAKHYGPKGLTWLDAQTKRWMEQAATGNKLAFDNVKTSLHQKLDDASNTSREQIVQDVVFAATDRDDDEMSKLSQTMKAFAQTLDGTFRAVHLLPGSLTATPGWLHTSNCVSLLDARASRLGSFDPHFAIHFPSFGDSAYLFSSSVFKGFPMAKIVECPDRDEVARVLGVLRPSLVSVEGRRAEWLADEIAEVADVDRERIWSFKKLFEDMVVLGAPDDNPLERYGYSGRRQRVPDKEVLLGSPEGLIAMKADIVRQLLELDKAKSDWNRALGLS